MQVWTTQLSWSVATVGWKETISNAKQCNTDPFGTIPSRLLVWLSYSRPSSENSADLSTSDTSIASILKAGGQRLIPSKSAMQQAEHPSQERWRPWPGDPGSG